MYYMYAMKSIWKSVSEQIDVAASGEGERKKLAWKEWARVLRLHL